MGLLLRWDLVVIVSKLNQKIQSTLHTVHHTLASCALNAGYFDNLGMGGAKIRAGEKQICTITEIFPSYYLTSEDWNDL